MESEVFTKLLTFVNQMIVILKEKEKENPNDLWKSLELGFLKYHLDKQINKPFLLDGKENQERTKRNMIHISNYCFFIWSRINKLKDDK